MPYSEARKLSEEMTILELIAEPIPITKTQSTSSEPAGTGRVEKLTPRELEVLRLIARGLTNNQVANELILSTLTVNAYLRSIYSKLEVTSRSAATRFALEQGLS